MYGERLLASAGGGRTRPGRHLLDLRLIAASHPAASNNAAPSRSPSAAFSRVHPSSGKSCVVRRSCAAPGPSALCSTTMRAGTACGGGGAG